MLCVNVKGLNSGERDKSGIDRSRSCSVLSNKCFQRPFDYIQKSLIKASGEERVEVT